MSEQSPTYLFGKKVINAGKPLQPSPLKAGKPLQTSPLSSWFLSPGGAPNFGKVTEVEVTFENTRNITDSTLVNALSSELEENEKFSLLLVQALGEGQLLFEDPQSAASTSIPNSPSS